MNKNPVGWFEIYVADMARAKAFYEATLTLRLSQITGNGFDFEMRGFPMQQDNYGASGALVKIPGVASGEIVR